MTHIDIITTCIIVAYWAACMLVFRNRLKTGKV